MAIEIVDLPINSMVIFHSFLYVYQRVQWTWTNSFDLLYPSSARWLKGYFSSTAPIFHKGFVSQLPQDPMVCHHFPIERAIWGIPEFETNPCHSAAYISPILFQCIHVYLLNPQDIKVSHGDQVLTMKYKKRWGHGDAFEVHPAIPQAERTGLCRV